MRVTFTFPREYPQVHHPYGGTPAVELERNPLISLKDRAFILRRLRIIRERRRPCLEACLRFLLFGHEHDHAGMPPTIDLESSSEDEVVPVSRKAKDFTVSLLRNNKNLAEPRTSQGIFGPNGEIAFRLCCNI
jgi:WD repeat-containing protein 59